MLAQDHVLGDREFLDHAVPHALLRNIGQHPVGQFSRGQAGDILAFQQTMRPEVTLRKPVMTSASSR